MLETSPDLLSLTSQSFSLPNSSFTSFCYTFQWFSSPWFVILFYLPVCLQCFVWMFIFHCVCVCVFPFHHDLQMSRSTSTFTLSDSTKGGAVVQRSNSLDHPPVRPRVAMCLRAPCGPTPEVVPEVKAFGPPRPLLQPEGPKPRQHRLESHPRFSAAPQMLNVRGDSGDGSLSALCRDLQRPLNSRGQGLTSPRRETLL